MKVAFCSLLLPEEKELTKRAKKRLPGISGHKLTSALIAGVDENLEEPVTVFNIINTFNFPNFPDLIFKTEKWSHRPGSADLHIGYINLFGIKYITQTYNLYKKLCKWKKQNAGEQCVVCVYNIHLPMLLAICTLKRKYGDGVLICLSTGDLTGKYNSIPYRQPGIKEWLIWQMGKYINKLAREFDCFVFATKYMAEALGVEAKPYTVLECTYSEPEYMRETAPEQAGRSIDKIIFYAGALKRNIWDHSFTERFFYDSGSALSVMDSWWRYRSPTCRRIYEKGLAHQIFRVYESKRSCVTAKRSHRPDKPADIGI